MLHDILVKKTVMFSAGQKGTTQGTCQGLTD